jgi:hypothetical protein
MRQLSLAPGFSRVVLATLAGNGFNRFSAGQKTKPLKRLDATAPAITGLKPGANETRQRTEMSIFPEHLSGTSLPATGQRV